MRFGRVAPRNARPLRLAVERYVHCPRRGGLALLQACTECELLQGTLVDDGLKVLCAYPQPVPALHAFQVGVMNDGPSTTSASGTPGPAGSPAPADGSAAPAASRAAGAIGRSRLIFETEWPDDE